MLLIALRSSTLLSRLAVVLSAPCRRAIVGALSIGQELQLNSRIIPIGHRDASLDSPLLACLPLRWPIRLGSIYFSFSFRSCAGQSASRRSGRRDSCANTKRLLASTIRKGCDVFSIRRRHLGPPKSLPTLVTFVCASGNVLGARSMRVYCGAIEHKSLIQFAF